MSDKSLKDNTGLNELAVFHIYQQDRTRPQVGRSYHSPVLPQDTASISGLPYDDRMAARDPGGTSMCQAG